MSGGGKFSKRLSEGGRIDRGRPLAFTFNGRRYRGFAGDTLASALLANGVRVVARSFKYHRPRGIFSAGVEEPNAIVQLETGAATRPNLQATEIPLYDGLDAASVNCWPSVDFDVGEINNLIWRLLPAGFYYKTFMWPARFWKAYEYVIRHAAGLGRAPQAPDPDTYDKMHVHTDVLVVGGGPAGLMAALAAAKTGARVMVVEQQTEFGGQLLNQRTEINGAPAMEWAAKTVETLAAMGEVRLLRHCTVFGYYDHNYLGLVENRPPGSATRQRLWKVRARQVVLATGAMERPLVFADNDRPGVMLAASARAYVNRYGVRPGRRAVVFTNNDDAYRTALDLDRAGVAVAAVIDARPEADGMLTDEVRGRDIAVLENSVIVAVRGAKGVRAVEVMTLAEGGGVSGEAKTIECDLVASSGGWNPAVHLFSQSGGKARFDENLLAFVPGRSAQRERSAGAANGCFELAGCLEQGLEAGRQAAIDAGFRKKTTVKAPPCDGEDEALPGPMWVAPSIRPVGQGAKHFIDLHNDVTAADIELAAREGYRSIEHVKRYTSLGMGPDQGKTGNIPGMGALAEALDVKIAAVGTTTFRPPFTPVPYGALAGREVGDLFDPIRRTPLHHWHARAGAAFEDVGQWKRPWYYPQKNNNEAGETMQDAVNRECLAVRNAVGILDATTLGKIDIQGPDARELLGRVYTNAWNKLAVGRCRYGLMLGEDGMVMDDGVTACLDENHFLMTTTTGNAARVMAWLEEWVQTEWPQLKVYLNSVTEAWATITLCGPRARDLLGEFTSDIDLGAEAFPFMSWRQGAVAGIPARVFRISFTGESSFEINVPSTYGLGLWTALINAGEKYGITPYGTEAMHVLRAEKGYIIVGQETDGTVTPHDLGLGGMLSKAKDFIGKRSLARADSRRDGRKQLVGLLTADPDQVLPEGAQMVARTKPSPPMEMIGHVTSSYYSANLGRSIALAMIEGGRERMGQTLYAPQISSLAGRTIKAEVTAPVFFDAEGTRLHG